MPIFTPTQVQGALAPLRAPQASKPSANPLNVLTAVSTFQRARALDQEAKALEARERDAELREQLAIFKTQNDLFEQINQKFRQGAARNSQKRQENNASSYGLNRDFFPAQAARVDAINNSFLKKSLDSVSNIQGLRGAIQAQTEILQTMGEMNRVLSSDADYQRALKNQNRYDDLINTVDDLASKGKSVNMTEINKLEDKLRQSGDPKDPIILRGSDFTVDRFIFDDTLGQASLAKTVEEATGKIDFARFSTEGPDGFITIERGEGQRAIDEARNLAFDAIMLSNDRNILGMADGIAFQQGTTRDEALLGMIEGKMGTFRNKIDDQITNLSIKKDVVGASTTGDGSRFKDEELNEIVEEIESQGFDADISADPANKDKIRRIKKAREAADPTTPLQSVKDDNGDLVFKTKDDEVARFPSPESKLIKEITDEGVQFKTREGEVFDIPETVTTQNNEQLQPGDNPGVVPDKLDKDLAFFTNNPLNIKGLDTLPVIKRFDNEKDGLFHRVFPTMEEGMKAGADLLKRYLTREDDNLPQNRAFAQNLIKKGKTIDEATLTDLYETWATSATEGKIKVIADELGIDPDEKLFDIQGITEEEFVFAIMRVENPEVFKQIKSALEKEENQTGTQTKLNPLDKFF
jgi:hypothetical protein